ncbi:hypothetical protein [Chondromyces crocatus]
MNDAGPDLEFVDPGLRDIEQVSANAFNTCAVDTRGELVCWGAGTSVLGQNAAQAFPPTLIMNGTRQVSMGFIHACAVMRDGTSRCWGENPYGSLGLGDMAPDSVSSPERVGLLMDIQEVASGGIHTCARSVNSTFCWGNNSQGQLGLGNDVDHHTPQLINLSRPDGLSVGSAHSGVIVGGNVYVWGDNTFGQLGTDDAFDALSPVKIDLPRTSKLAFAGSTSCALLEDRRILCWGSNGRGQLGDGTTTSRARPEAVIWP